MTIHDIFNHLRAIVDNPAMSHLSTSDQNYLRATLTRVAHKVEKIDTYNRELARKNLAKEQS